MGKHSSLLQTFVNYGRKKFKIGPRWQFHQHFQRKCTDYFFMVL